MWGRLSNTLQLVQDRLEESLGEEKDESTLEQEAGVSKSWFLLILNLITIEFLWLLSS